MDDFDIALLVYLEEHLSWEYENDPFDCRDIFKNRATQGSFQNSRCHSTDFVSTGLSYSLYSLCRTMPY